MEVAGIPARFAIEDARILVRLARLRLHRRLGPENDADVVLAWRLDDLGLAYDDLPSAHGHGARHVASRRGLNAYDGRLAIASAPAAKPVRVVEPPVENVLGGKVIVPNFDFSDALGDLERQEEVGLRTLGHGALNPLPRAGFLRAGDVGGEHETGGKPEEM